MSQFGSMDEEKVVKKPLLPSAMKKTKPPPSFLSQVQVLSLLAALVFGCLYAGFAACNLCDALCQYQCQEQEPEPEPEPAWLIPRYVVTGADNVAATLALLCGLLWCGAPQAAAAAPALALLAGGRRGIGSRAAACVALAATAASHWMYFSILGRIDSPVDLLLAVETAAIAAAAALDLLWFMAFVLGLGGDE